MFFVLASVAAKGLGAETGGDGAAERPGHGARGDEERVILNHVEGVRLGQVRLRIWQLREIFSQY